MTSRIRVPATDFIVVDRRGRTPRALRYSGVVEVYGGRHFDGNGYRPGDTSGRRFSFGVDAPDRVDLIVGDKRMSLRDVERLLVGVGAGGAMTKTRNASEILGALARGSVVGTDGNYASEIADARQTHVLDNGAMMSIADDGPVYPDEMPDSVAPTESGTDEVLGGENIGRKEAVRGGESGPFRDDFVDRLHQQAKAAIGPNGEILDEFDQMYRLQSMQHEAIRTDVPFRNTNPASALKAILGGQIAVSTGPSVGGIVPKGQVTTVAYWQSDDIETRVVTITLAPVQKGTNNNSGAPLRPYAVVTFSTRGVSTTIEVDIGNGCEFTVSGSAVTVSVGMDGATVAGLPDGTQATALLAGMISFGQIIRTTPITRTIYLDNLAGVGLKSLIPAGAKRVWFYRMNSATVAATIEMDDSISTARYDYALAAGAQMSDPIVLSGDVVAVTVTKTAGATTVGELVFELAI